MLAGKVDDQLLLDWGPDIHTPAENNTRSARSLGIGDFSSPDSHQASSSAHNFMLSFKSNSIGISMNKPYQLTKSYKLLDAQKLDLHSTSF